ncbi:MAG TPA: hypothetical protein VF889_01005 [Bacteroidota bacterium]
MANFVTRALRGLFQEEIDQRVKFILTGADGFYDRGAGPDSRDRFDYDREEILRQALEAWRTNPLARRIVELATQYVLGPGLTIESKHEPTHKFINAFWQHPLNQMPMRIFEFCDELTRSGELFLLLSTGADGMSYIRALPAIEVEQVITQENDLSQEVAVIQKACFDQDHGGTGGSAWRESKRWPVYNSLTDLQEDSGAFPTVCLHYAVNRPAGAVRGESDLAPLLRWLTRYSAWLEDRARLNRFRNTFLFVVKGRFASETERAARQTALNAAPPSPGSILVCDESEAWETIHPQLDSGDANTDGLALKKMIASGSGIPLHFLAEPESATRTTAESAGGPTFRHFEQRQTFFVWMISDLLRVIIRRRAMVSRSVRENAPVSVRGADISGRDNAAMSVAAATIVGAFTEMRDRGLIDDAELLRVVYKFAGEVGDVEELLKRGSSAPNVSEKNPNDHKAPGPNGKGPTKPGQPGKPAGIKVNPVSGDLKGEN